MRIDELIKTLEGDVELVGGNKKSPVVFSVTENKNETVGYVYDGVSIMNNGTVVIELVRDESEDEEEDEENDQD